MNAGTSASTSVRFYTCEAPTLDKLVGAGQVSHCETDLLSWLDSLTAGLESWQPQAVTRAQIAQAIDTATDNAITQCEAGRFASIPATKTGVSINVTAHVKSGGTSNGGTNDDGRIRAVVPISFSAHAPEGGTPGSGTGGTGGTGDTGGTPGSGGAGGGPADTGCPPIPFHILHRPAVSGNEYPENTVLETTATPPARNGSASPMFTDTLVFSINDQRLPWRSVIHKMFTGGTWRIVSARVFNHYALWNVIQTPPPGANLLARSEAFDGSRVNIDMPNFPLMTALGPRWRVVHRYTHQTSGRYFWFATWITPLNSTNASWTAAPDFGRGYTGSFVWKFFEAPDDGQFFDPEGTWTHETGLIGFAMNSVELDVSYAGASCERAYRTISEPSILDPYTAPFLSAQAGFAETVEVRTIKQYKAAFRLVELRRVNGIGVFVRVRVINDFAFAACMVAVIPLGTYASKAAGGRADVVVIRNLTAKSESNLVEFLLPMADLTAGTQIVTMQAFASDVAVGKRMIGLALPNNTFPDGVYLNATNFAAAIVATIDSQKAECWGFYDTAGNRFWQEPNGVSSNPAAQELFSFDVDPGITLGSQYHSGLTLTAVIRGERNVPIPGVTRSQFPTGGYRVLSGGGYTGFDYSPRYCPSNSLDQFGSNLQTIGLAVTSTVNGVTSNTTTRSFTGYCTMNEELSQVTSSQSFWLFNPGQGFKVWTWGMSGPYTLAWDIVADATAITVEGNRQYEAARWRWDPFEETRSATMSRETFIARYGRSITLAAGSADGNGASSVIGDWSTAADVEQTLIDELLTTYSDTNAYRAITSEVTKHPTLAVSRAALSEDDYPGGIPANLDGQLHVLLQSGTQVMQAIWT